ncbi:MAG: tRNA1(Val) (adenine(37)-N6)-methyltransferase [Bacteroidales bacterium]
MASDFFEFKQFKVYHNQCGMKVGTDAVLIGSWCSTYNINSVLDIGTGSGIISLMIAQRCNAKVKAIDIDNHAVMQAESNFSISPWYDRMSVFHADFSDYAAQTKEKYDLIVSNPPYFTNGILANCKKRSTARHTNSLNYQQLFEGVVQILNDKGRFALILPVDAETEIEELARLNHLYMVRKCNVFPKPDGVIKRLMWEFSKEKVICSNENLVVELDRHIYSPDYIRLTKDFYLKM